MPYILKLITRHIQSSNTYTLTSLINIFLSVYFSIQFNWCQNFFRLGIIMIICFTIWTDIIALVFILTMFWLLYSPAFFCWCPNFLDWELSLFYILLFGYWHVNLGCNTQNILAVTLFNLLQMFIITSCYFKQNIFFKSHFPVHGEFDPCVWQCWKVKYLLW